MAKNNPHNIEIGQTLYKPSGKSIMEYVVTKIGKKYFYANGLDKPHGLDDLMHRNPQYSQANYQLYTSKQDIEDEREYGKLNSAIVQYFNRYTGDKPTLNQLRNVATILGISLTK